MAACCGSVNLSAKPNADANAKPPAHVDFSANQPFIQSFILVSYKYLTQNRIAEPAPKLAAPPVEPVFPVDVLYQHGVELPL